MTRPHCQHPDACMAMTRGHHCRRCGQMAAHRRKKRVRARADAVIIEAMLPPAAVPVSASDFRAAMSDKLDRHHSRGSLNRGDLMVGRFLRAALGALS